MADKYFRLVSFVVNICPEPLRKMFIQYASTDKGRIFTTLDDYLQFRKKDILGSRKFRKDQLILLYPYSSDADECQWDVSLLVSLITELFASRINVLVKIEINEIREIRNRLQHPPTTSSLTDQEYNQFWNGLRTATLSLARHTDGPTYENDILAKIDEIRNGTMSNIFDTLRIWHDGCISEMASRLEEMQAKIDEMSPHTKETASIVRKATVQTPGPTGEKVKRFKTVDSILSKLKANFNATMEEELRGSFDPPPEAANIRTLLRDKHYVVVTGNCSSRYLETALAAIKEMNYTPERCADMSTSLDWRHFDPEDIDLVLCIDPFGKGHYDETKAKSMADVFDNMLLTSKGNTIAERIDIVLVTDCHILTEVMKQHDHEILEDAVKVFAETTEKNPADLTLGPDISIGTKGALNPVASNLKEITRIFIQHYGDDKIPVDDASIKDAREVFKKNKVVVLVGPKEYGKVLAVAMASSYKPSQCLLLTRPDDTLLIDSDVCLAIIDQFAGKYRYSEEQVVKWYDMFDHLHLAVKAGRLNVVITCEKEKLERCRQVFQHALLEHTVNLPEKGFNNVKNEIVSEEPVDILDMLEDQTLEQTDSRQKQHKRVRRNQYGEALIHIAAQRPILEDLKSIIDSGADVNARDHANWTPLHDACYKGLADNAKCLLQRGADIGALGDKNNTPLHEAALSGNIELVQMLLEHGANPEQQNDVGETPADVAASSDINALLIDACVKRNTNKENRHHKQHKKVRRNYHGETPLHIAAKKSNVEKLKKTIIKSPDVDVRDYAGWTPLHEACGKGLVENAVCLLQAGADIGALGYGNNTPLHEASSSGNEELVQMLLERGANPEQRNNDGKTPADVASSSDIYALIDACVNGNVNIDAIIPSERKMSMTEPMHEEN